MFTKFKRKSLLLLLAVSVIGFNACKKNNSNTEEPAEKNYGLLVSAGTPAASYILNTSNLAGGTLTTAGNGAETSTSIITQKGEYFYGVNANGNLVKFTSSNKTTTVISQVQFNQISWAYYSSFFAWKDDNTLVLFSINQALQFEYATLNVSTMTITASGNISIPKPLTGYYYWGNNAVFLGNKLYISYNVVQDGTNIPLNEIRLASMDFPNVSNVTITTDNRFNQPAHYNLNSPGTFVYNDYAYMLNAPTIWIAGETGGSFSIYRVASGATTVDANYQYEITDRTKEEVSGLFNVGNGKAIVKVIDKSQIASFQDYDKRISSFYIIDVVNKTKTKINIPLSIARPYSNDILIDGDVAYIAASTADGYYVYNYTISTNTVTRGAKLEGVNGVNQLVKYK
ncbi:hypothetical protein [Pedobacter xixiisoli]|uniref:DUF4374 domain-containing protein n=1 Tax=Pedobacter xixiisoli TaxID=1476464 RepID=A0A286A6P7_9SPHI|nr:hypothetical protein [Pedobacter xixiisoli]SOD17588.1 hypothetical protein SAMN06297358_2586 [Pedobacter xixiisoli]